MVHEYHGQRISQSLPVTFIALKLVRDMSSVWEGLQSSRTISSDPRHCTVHPTHCNWRARAQCGATGSAVCGDTVLTALY